MEVTILGSGTAMPVQDHSPAGVLLRYGGSHLLVDAGPGTLSRLNQMGISPQQVHTLLLTHLHPDHTLDLATFLQVFDSDPTGPRKDPFFIYGCRGTKTFYRRLITLYPAIKPRTYPVILHELSRDAIDIDGLHIQSMPSGHTKESISYRFKDRLGSLVISGDASEHGELASLACGADVLVCECSFPANWQTEDHLNADAVARLAVQSGVKSLVITHCYPPALAADLTGQIRSVYPGPLTIAKDGSKFTVGREAS